MMMLIIIIISLIATWEDITNYDDLVANAGSIVLPLFFKDVVVACGSFRTTDPPTKFSVSYPRETLSCCGCGRRRRLRFTSQDNKL